MCACIIGMVCVETSGNSQTCDPKGLAARGQFNCLKVPLVDRGAYKIVYFG